MAVVKMPSGIEESIHLHRPTGGEQVLRERVTRTPACPKEGWHQDCQSLSSRPPAFQGMVDISIVED